MLVLTRKIGEKLVMGDRAVIDGDIVLTVLEVKGGRVRLGIVAAETVFIHREEVLLRRLRQGGDADATP